MEMQMIYCCEAVCLDRLKDRPLYRECTAKFTDLEQWTLTGKRLTSEIHFSRDNSNLFEFCTPLPCNYDD